MYPPEQAPALKLIYEARAQLVRQNEAEIQDLKRRLEQATKKQAELLELMESAKANYDEAASKIVDLLDDNEGEDDSGGYVTRLGNESKHSPPPGRPRNPSGSKDIRHHKNRDNGNYASDKARDNEAYEVSRGNESKNPSPRVRLRNPYSRQEKVKREARENPYSEEDYEVKRSNESKHAPPQSRSINPKNSGCKKEDAKPAAFQHDRGTSVGTNLSLVSTPSNDSKISTITEVVDLQESDEEDYKFETDHIKDTIPRKSSHTTIISAKRTNNAAQKQEKLSPTSKSKSSIREKKVRSSNGSTNPTQQNGGRRTNPTQKRPRSSSTSSSSSRGKSEPNPTVTQKKRASSSSSSFTRRITLRPRPRDIPPNRWLKSSVGRTAEELNQIDDMVQYMGSCKFGKSVVVSLYGKVYAMVLNDELNTLAQRNDEFQFWYVCLGPGRKRDARLVGASQSTIPIFHAPRVEYTTKELFYVGHYRVKNLEELNPPVIEMAKERDVRVTFAFERFDERLDSIIKRGSNAKSS